MVPNDQLSLAIGKEGQNARLAAKLTGWRIDIKSERQFEEELSVARKERVDKKENLCLIIWIKNLFKENNLNRRKDFKNINR